MICKQEWDTSSKSADYAKLGDAADFLEGWEPLYMDIEHWAISNSMKFNKDTLHVLHLEWINVRHKGRLGD